MVVRQGDGRIIDKFVWVPGSDAVGGWMRVVGRGTIGGEVRSESLRVISRVMG